MSLDCGRKLDYMGRTHTHGGNMQIPYRKALTRWWIQTQDLLAVRQQRKLLVNQNHIYFSEIV